MLFFVAGAAELGATLIHPWEGAKGQPWGSLLEVLWEVQAMQIILLP